jgi:hypothetical protein
MQLALSRLVSPKTKTFFHRRATMKKTIFSHSIIAAALLGFGLAANADEKMKSDSSSAGASGATSTQGEVGAAGPKADAAKDCPPGQTSGTDSSSGAAGRTGSSSGTSDRTPEGTKANPPEKMDQTGTSGQGSTSGSGSSSK